MSREQEQDHHNERLGKSPTNDKLHGESSIVITMEKLNTYEKYASVGRNYDRVTKRDLGILPFDEYIFIERLITDLKLVSNNLASKAYADKTNKLLSVSCDNQRTIDNLLNFAAKV